jgi:hypothetical protein
LDVLTGSTDRATLPQIAGARRARFKRGIVPGYCGKPRSHRLLAVAAVANTDIDRLALGLEPDSTAQASAFSGHVFSATMGLK